jgi:arginyl-tRNA--protein-N-Asp/Glu arginylyltransferase
MNDLAAVLINEEFTESSVTPAEHDRLLADGWRHFGQQFFRYNLAIYGNEIRSVIPLRIRLSEFRLSKSQQRVLRRNADTSVDIGPVRITPEVGDLFTLHKQRFKQHLPDSIYTFMSRDPDAEPCETFQQSVRSEGRLLAAGFFDVGEHSVSGIYTAFEPEETRRSLGIFTILKEIEYAIGSGHEFYYQGYCYSGSSFYDYKKRLSGTEAYGWNGVWTPLPGTANC